MKRIFVMFGVVFVAAFLFTGCSTMDDVIKSKKEGTSRVYHVNFEQAWDIAKTVFRWEGADTIEEHKKDGYMLTSSGVNLVSYGAVMGAWIEPVGEDKTMVTVVTKRRISVNLATTLTEKTFHKRFAQAVKIIKEGKKLPITPPAE
jgi:hypothetical protein